MGNLLTDIIELFDYAKSTTLTLERIKWKSRLNWTTSLVLALTAKGQINKYDFQRESTIPLLDTQGMPTILKLKKVRFQCKECRRVVVSETSLVRKNCQTSQIV